MHYWVGITDRDWFETLRRLQPDEVNFWQPSQQAPRTMDAGWPFLFKLHSPQNFVVGGGFFVRFTELPCFLAWNAFREKNGASSLVELADRGTRFRKAPQIRRAIALERSGSVDGSAGVRVPGMAQLRGVPRMTSVPSPSRDPS